MRDLTFAGFLKSYVRSLSLTETNSLYKLAEEAAEKNPRLREPLLLYAFFTDKTDVLLRAVRVPTLHAEYKSLVDRYAKMDLEAVLRDPLSPLSEGYKKVWRSYLSKKNRVKNDNHTKELMRNQAVKLQKAKGVSNYRLYTDLELNPGNFNTWLKHGIPNKVSLATARKTVTYLRNFPQTP
jgi:hypothetical protein